MDVKLFLSAMSFGLLSHAAQFSLSPDMVGSSGNAFLRTADGPSKLLSGIMNSLNMLDADGLDARPLSDVQHDIAQLVTSGNTSANRLAVKTMAEFIEGKLVPRREKAHAWDQQRINAHIKEIEGCSLEKKKQTDSVHASNMSSLDFHKGMYEKHSSQHKDCMFVEEARDLVKEAECQQVKDVEKTCMCHHDLVQLYGLRPECMQSSKKAANGMKCCDKYALLQRHREQCNKEKDALEHASLQRSIIKDKLCRQYDACYEDKVKAYKAMEKTAKENESRRGWRGIYHMQCLIKAFDKGPVPQKVAQQCEEEAKVTKFIKVIAYPKIPQKEKCDVPKAVKAKA